MGPLRDDLDGVFLVESGMDGGVAILSCYTCAVRIHALEELPAVVGENVEVVQIPLACASNHDAMSILQRPTHLLDGDGNIDISLIVWRRIADEAVLDVVPIRAKAAV